MGEQARPIPRDIFAPATAAPASDLRELELDRVEINPEAVRRGLTKRLARGASSPRNAAKGKAKSPRPKSPVPCAREEAPAFGIVYTAIPTPESAAAEYELPSGPAFEDEMAFEADLRERNQSSENGKASEDAAGDGDDDDDDDEFAFDAPPVPSTVPSKPSIAAPQRPSLSRSASRRTEQQVILEMKQQVVAASTEQTGAKLDADATPASLAELVSRAGPLGEPDEEIVLPFVLPPPLAEEARSSEQVLQATNVAASLDALAEEDEAAEGEDDDNEDEGDEDEEEGPGHEEQGQGQHAELGPGQVGQGNGMQEDSVHLDDEAWARATASVSNSSSAPVERTPTAAECVKMLLERAPTMRALPVRGLQRLVPRFLRAPAPVAMAPAELLQLSSMPLEWTRPEHCTVMRALHHRLTGRRAAGQPGPHWEALGFQGFDPATDLRGSGLLGVVHMIELAERDPELASRLLMLSRVEEAPSHAGQNDELQAGFPLMAVSLNFTLLSLQTAPRKGLDASKLFTGLWAALAEQWQLEWTVEDFPPLLDALKRRLKTNAAAIAKLCPAAPGPAAATIDNTATASR